MTVSRLTKKNEPPPTRDLNRDTGTASADSGRRRRLVRLRRHDLGQMPTALGGLDRKQIARSN